ncbi:7-deoxyloganetin glucosyltransferase-like [Asparagus officinalis]|nr:7-deoxyloganetin glucosyltransferase-like [Asparagus officinalis]
MGLVPSQKPHALLIPYPAQGHVTPMLKLAKLLHSKGFFITFVNTEHNHRRLVRSRGLDSVKGLDDFRFESIPDGLPDSDEDATQDIPALCESITKNCLDPFRELLKRLNSSEGWPLVSCIVSDAVMSFTLDAAEEFGILEVMFWSPSACGIMGYLHYQQLMERGLFPLKDEGDLTSGYLDTPIDWIPGMKNIRLKDLPTFIRATNPDDIMFNYCNREARRASRASAIILNTFIDLERPILDSMAKILPPIYTIGPLSLLSSQLPPSKPLESLSSSLWKEDKSCIEWLDAKKPGSVVYVNFGSITVMSNEQLVEFAWGLANSKSDFLWIIRPDLVKGDNAILPEEFIKETRERSLLASWCAQENVLLHPSVGGFLTHSGWNSTLESICGGVPMICWPFFGEQQTNCRYACTNWGIGMEISNDVKREEVEELVRELMGGAKGKEMKRRALEWKESAIRTTKLYGSSFENFEKLVREVLLRHRKS